MTSFLDVGLCNALLALALALPAALVGRLTRRPALAHALWLLVLLKLVTPPLFYWPISYPEMSAHPAGCAAGSPADSPEDLPGPADAPDGEIPPVPLPEERPGGDLAGPEGEGGGEGHLLPPVGERVPDALSWSWRPVAAGLWLAGSVGWFLLALLRVRNFQAELRHSARAPDALQERARELARRLGLAAPPEVRVVPGRVAPLLWWVGGPAWLVVPGDLLGQLSATALDTLLLHELAHYRRRDHWVRALEFLVLGLYWWHPIAWFACRELREAEELCCDAWVVTALPASARAYATALVDTLDFLAGADPMPLTASGIGPVADLKRRLTMILRGVPPRALSWPACLTVLALACALLPWLPAWGQQPAARTPATVTDPATERRAAEKAELQVLQADLDRKTAELELAKARLKAAQADLAGRAAEKKEPDPRANPFGARERPAAPYIRATRTPEGVTIQIHISGLAGKPEELKEVIKALEKDLPGKEKRVIIVQSLSGSGIVPPVPRVRGVVEVPPANPARPAPPAPPARATPPAASLENKLDHLLQEVESLRRELKGSDTPAVPPATRGR